MRQQGVDGQLVVTAAEALHEGMADGDSGGRAHLFQPAHRPQPSLQPSMIALEHRGYRRSSLSLV